MAKSLVVKIVGDASDYSKSLDQAEGKTKSFGSSLKTLGKAGAAGAAIAGVALVTKGLMDSVNAAKDAEAAQIRLQGALKSAGVSYQKHGAAIDAAITKTSRLAALDDEDLSDAFAKLVRTTGDVTKATEGMNLAADIARARGVSLEVATKAVEKAMLGSDAALKKFGVSVPKVTHAVDALKVQQNALKEELKGATGAHKEQIEAQLDLIKKSMASAAAADKQATSTAALEKATKQFSGSAEQYGKSSAAAQERFQVAVENLQEAIGKKLLPVFNKLMNAAADLVGWLEKNGPTIGKVFDTAFKVVEAAAKPVINYIENMVKIVGDLIRGVKAVIDGDWQKAWDSFSDIPKRMIDIFKGTMLALPQFAGEIALKIGAALVDKIVDGVKALPGLWWAGFTAQLNLLQQLPGAVATAASNVGEKILAAVVKGITGGVGSLGGLGAKLGEALDGLGGVGTAVWNAAKEVGSRILEGLVAAIKAYVGIGNAIAGRVADAVSSIGDNLLAAGRAVAIKIKDGIGNTLGFGNTIAKLISDGANAVQSALTGVGAKIGGWIKAGLSGVGNLISGAFSSAVNTAINLLNAAIRAYNAIPLAPNIGTIPNIGGGSSVIPGASNPGVAGPPNPARTTQVVDTGGGAPAPAPAPAPVDISGIALPPGISFNDQGQLTGNSGSDVTITPGPSTGRVYAFAEGGIVRKPTVGMVGEAGPEAVLPLSQLSRFTGGRRGNMPEVHIHAGTVVTERELIELVWQGLLRYQKLAGNRLGLT